MKNNPPARKSLGSDLLRGVVFTFGLLLLLLLIGAILHLTPVAMGLWFVLLFATRNLWIDPFVRVVYRKRWTKIFLWPISLGDEQSAVSILRAITWGYLVIGAMIVLIGILTTTT